MPWGMNFDGLTGLYMLVSFNCDHCTAVLSIPEEQAGISGPCPFCGETVTSPQCTPAVMVVPELPFANDDPPTSRDEPPRREWREPRVIPVTEPVLPFRPQRIALKVAAGVVVFVGGVAGTWKLWHGDKSRPENKAPVGEIAPAETPKRVAPAVSDAEETLPPPSDTIPALSPAAPVAIARNVSTAPSPRVVNAAPAAEIPTLFPDTGSGVQAGAAGKPAPAKPAENAPVSAEEKKIREVVPLTGVLAAPGTALIKFLSAKSWQERLKYSLAPEKVKPQMEAYYKVNKDAAIVPEDVEFVRMDPVEDDPQRHYFAFRVYFPGRTAGVPISVEETKTGCLVEWTSFVEGKDMLLEKFYSKYRKEPGTFRILLRRGHYFEKDVPDQKKKIVFDVNPPDRTGPYKLWLNKDSADAKKFFRDDQLDWNQVMMLVVTLQWEKTPDGKEFVRLHSVAADSWHPEMVASK